MPLVGAFSGNIYGTNTAIGAVSWVNASSAQKADDAYATVAMSGGSISRYLVATSFGLGFFIPTWSYITGIVVEIEKSADSAGRFQDYAIRLVSDNLVEGVLIGDDLANSANLTATDAVTTYGSSSSKWGVEWTPADIGLGNFGVAYAAVDSASGAGAATVRVDQIRMTVYYYPTRGLEPPDRMSMLLG